MNFENDFPPFEQPQSLPQYETPPRIPHRKPHRKKHRRRHSKRHTDPIPLEHQPYREDVAPHRLDDERDIFYSAGGMLRSQATKSRELHDALMSLQESGKSKFLFLPEPMPPCSIFNVPEIMTKSIQNIFYWYPTLSSFEMRSLCIDLLVDRFGVWASSYPCITILVALVLCAVTSSGNIFFYREYRPEYLWTPTNTEVFD